MKVITSLLAILALSAVTSFAADGDAPKKPEGDKGKPKMTPEQMFTKKDADKDGKLSKEEFLKGAKDAAKAEAAFTAKDKDKDGSLSKEEFTAAPKKKKAA
ncbi:EF-hand domain-containing protein [Prosthecobacter vanneervenii]|uniref:Ca2+-binding EF-hand superfamily protein n=1 Tax=Prosthecobacter vanneervenii TaxID=48466 RepID=A0A7W7YC10_9BACT|nr:EF-hand domain-containing protein [Prosthecobacter vanneervenii]MBB5033237.1 Ca2+-binding EF-hand superfamily protein [Prosthecobacter vanneervenii]